MNRSMAIARRAHAARLVGYASWVGLALLQVAWYAWWVPPERGSGWLTAGVAVVPLLLPLLAVRRPTRALLWAGILALFYFCHGIWSMPVARAPATLEVLLSAALVCTLATAFPKHPRVPADTTD